MPRDRRTFPDDRLVRASAPGQYGGVYRQTGEVFTLRAGDALGSWMVEGRAVDSADPVTLSVDLPDPPEPEPIDDDPAPGPVPPAPLPPDYPPPPPEPEPIDADLDLDALHDEDLRDLILKVTGNRPRVDAKRDTLLARAKALKAASTTH